MTSRLATHPAAHAPAGGPVLRVLRAAMGRIAAYDANFRQREALRRMDGARLRDIGLTRAEADGAFAGRMTRAPGAPR